MKHKRFDLANWHRWDSGQVSVLHLPAGVLADFQAERVKKELIVPFRGRDLRIFADGYRWIHFAPSGQNHALTAQLDERGVPQQLYVDLCDGHGVDPDGLPYVNDLYLDVLAACDVQPDGRWHVTDTEIIDVQDLEDALAAAKVTPAQYALAWAEARAVEAALREQRFAPLDVVRGYLSDPYT